MEKELRVLFAAAAVNEYNFKMLHWNCCGDNFDTMHNKARDYYYDMGNLTDQVAEMILRSGFELPGFVDLPGILEESAVEFAMVTPDDYNFSDFVTICDKIFNSLLVAVENVLADEAMETGANTGMRSYLEGFHDRLDIECRYLNKRRNPGYKANNIKTTEGEPDELSDNEGGEPDDGSEENLDLDDKTDLADDVEKHDDDHDEDDD